jgi:hypothetical protein
MKKLGALAMGVLLLVGFSAIFLPGQTIDPAGLFPEIAGWQKKGAVESYSPENLYEYIDGAAENFIGYDFKQLAVQNYANDKGQALSAEIYFHGSAENAFGIYSSEKPLAGNYLELGGQGYAETGILNFVCSAYYVKISGFELGDKGQDVLVDLGRALADRIDARASLPEILRTFPGAGKIADSERFILNNFLGHDFLHSAYTADYKVNGQAFRLFIIAAASEADARAMLEKFVALEKKNPAPSVNSPRGTDTAVQPVALTVNDPYNGPIRLVWRGKFICGSGGQTPAAAEGITALAQNLPQQ